MEIKQHFVLVHGSCHGAWCWYKLVPLLKLAGHRVTALDLGASGIHPVQLDQLHSFSDYIQPLMEFMDCLPQDEKVILVGHSYAGLCISLAMEKFPEKILVAVFVTAYMPNTAHPPASLAQEFFSRTPLESILDTQITMEEDIPVSLSFGPNYVEKIMYQNCQLEDVELCKMMLRPFKFFFKDLAVESLLSEAKYGSVNRVFVICEEDAVMKEEFQEWVIQNSPAKEVKSIRGAGHMVMLSKSKELCQCFNEIAVKYN